jgi:hypothetical protein
LERAEISMMVEGFGSYQFYNYSPDCSDILFGCGRSEAEPVTKKIQRKAGKASKINQVWIKNKRFREPQPDNALLIKRIILDMSP